ncbi:MAG: sensor histidine kinase [Bacteroidota bacterium]
MHHRVKNNLQMISGMTFFQTDDEMDDDFAKAMRNRVRSIALVHEKLIPKTYDRSIDAAEYIHELVEEILNGIAGPSRKQGVSINIEAVRLKEESMFPIGLIINEAVTNALKHCSSKSADIWLRIRLFLENDELVLLIENPPTMPLPEPESGAPKGYGLELIRVFAEKLNGKLRFSSDPFMIMNLCFPLTHIKTIPRAAEAEAEAEGQSGWFAVPQNAWRHGT